MIRLKNKPFALSTVLAVLALVQGACSPVSPSEAKNSKVISDSTINTGDLELTAVPFQKAVAQMISNKTLSFITPDQYAVLESAAKESSTDKSGFYVTELPDNALGGLKKDSYVSNVDMNDLGLSPRLLRKRRVRAFAVMDTTLDATALETLNNRFQVRYSIQKTSEDKLRGNLEIAFTLKDGGETRDPIKDLDAAKLLSESIRKLIFILKQTEYL